MGLPCRGSTRDARVQHCMHRIYVHVAPLAHPLIACVCRVPMQALTRGRDAPQPILTAAGYARPPELRLKR